MRAYIVFGSSLDGGWTLYDLLVGFLGLAPLLPHQLVNQVIRQLVDRRPPDDLRRGDRYAKIILQIYRNFDRPQRIQAKFIERAIRIYWVCEDKFGHDVPLQHQFDRGAPASIDRSETCNAIVLPDWDCGCAHRTEAGARRASRPCPGVNLV